MKKLTIVRYFFINFALMLLGCLVVDLATYMSNKTTNIPGSLIVASIGAMVVTLIYYITERRKLKRNERNVFCN